MKMTKAILAATIAGIGIFWTVDSFKNSQYLSQVFHMMNKVKKEAEPDQDLSPTLDHMSVEQISIEQTQNEDSLLKDRTIEKKSVLDLSDSLLAVVQANAPELNVKENTDGQAMITNPSSPLVLVNKQRNLPPTYEPEDLIIPEVDFSFTGYHPKKQLRKPAAEALEKLFHKAKENEIDLKAVSGYRSYETQYAIFNHYSEEVGEDAANKWSALPGQSEHQTGLAIDVSSSSVGYDLIPSFGDSKEGKWLSENAAEFGFILRYPKQQEEITGYSYEPWHLRFIGVELAKIITEQNRTLEDVFSKIIR
ncbi:M15 family metallopeptidase [Paenibacillus spongiae]|uniref:M15 family metallopeptidase n=1 Tax=Paenibacillus spongiae TaxID=2909671 RepID=A0ABY5SHH6_9BACL|nr:M15 family metallopeptidase [Paenibacillus spongiae]UVI33446.1 M15 family metallopeptidase [Paenibacillus spongiae]